MKNLFVNSLILLSVTMFFTGFKNQEKKHILPATEFSEKINETTDALIIDVRTPKEFALGHLSGALNIDFKNESFSKHILSLDKAKSVFVYCQGGNRSAKAVKQIIAANFKEVYELEKGISGWRKAGLPEVDEAKQFNHESGKSLEIDGAQIYYEEIGNKDKPALLVLHGGFQNIADMNPILTYLPDSFRIIGIDSRGHGKSTLGSEQLTYERLQSDIEAILKHLAIDTVNIIGFSDGGVLGLRIASGKKVNVKKLVSIGGSWSLKDVLATEEVYKSITGENAKEYFAESYKSYQQLNPQPDFASFTKVIVGMWTDKTSTGHPDEQVKNITAKTLIIRGENDFAISLESANELKETLKDAHLLNVPFSEHSVLSLIHI